MVKVEADKKVAEEKTQACAVDERAASEAAAIANAIKTDCQKDLDAALPEYYNAIKSLDALDKKDIQEVKSYAKPPALVMTVMEAVCLLMGQKTDWSDAKVLLNQSNFLQQLAEYDKDNIPEKKIKSIQKYMKMADFNPADVKKAVSYTHLTLPTKRIV